MPTAYTLPIKLFGGISTLTDLDLLQACVIVRSERYRTTHVAVSQAAAAVAQETSGDVLIITQGSTVINHATFYIFKTNRVTGLRRTIKPLLWPLDINLA